MERLAEVAREGLRTDIPAFDPGVTIRVMVRVREGDKERLQAFEGLVIAKRGGGISENFTVRKVSAGVGVERLFPLHSPTIGKHLRNAAPSDVSDEDSLLVLGCFVAFGVKSMDKINGREVVSAFLFQRTAAERIRWSDSIIVRV